MLIFIFSRHIVKVFPSQSDAMACSKAMVLSRQTNMIYYYYKNFYVMCEPDAEDIANKISKLVVDGSLRKQLALNAKNLVDTTLNRNCLIENTLQCIKS